jgi:hypothetical protein
MINVIKMDFNLELIIDEEYNLWKFSCDKDLLPSDNIKYIIYDNILYFVSKNMNAILSGYNPIEKIEDTTPYLHLLI